MKHFTDRKDLTRWNRGGLSHFRYVDANAVTLLEALRVLMADAFTEAGDNQWQALNTAIPVPANETSSEREARWQEQYRAARRDYAWEILRSYARSGHILLEYLNAYANENFLRTAQEWDDVRRLVEMLDYHPAPPASAETSLALMVKEGQTGSVDGGFAVKNKPVDGSKPAIFETLDDLDVDAALNELRAADWNASQEAFDYNSASQSAVFPLGAPVENIAAGSLGVLLVEGESQTYGVGVAVDSIGDAQLVLHTATPSPTLPTSIRDHQVRLLVDAAEKRKPLLYGADVITLTEDHGLSLGSVAAWFDGSWKVAKVEEISSNRVRLSAASPEASESLYLCDFSDAQDYNISGGTERRIVLPTHRNDERYYAVVWDENLEAVSDVHSHATESGEFLFDYFPAPSQRRLYYIPMRDPVATVRSAGETALLFDGKPKKIQSGDWVVVQDGDGDYHCASVEGIEESPDYFNLLLSRDFDEVTAVYYRFVQELRPLNYDQNLEPVFLTGADFRSSVHSTIPLPGVSSPQLLKPGRDLLLVGKTTALAVTIKAWDEETEQLTVSPAVSGSLPSESGTTEDFTRYHTRILGNVAIAGHGETQNRKILGSGDATRNNQSFHLAVDNVSFVSDPRFASGVSADLTIKVDGREYQQVSSLNNSTSEDPHYIVRMQQDGSLKITFGDGRRARRLPSGTNNVSVVCRTGNGLAGNLNPYSLVKAVKPHQILDEVVQPVPATSGNDMESAASMRDHAPASTLTLDRAVSVKDFADLAMANSGVWQATARREARAFSRGKKINVVVVPAGGGDLGSLAESLQKTLTNHTLPEIRVAVSRYRALLISLHLIINVKTDEYELEVVKDTVESELLRSFSLQNARLGQLFYHSQVLQVVEEVTGVENCQSQIFPDFVDENNDPASAASTMLTASGNVKRLTPEWDQLVYVHEGLSTITIQMQEFAP